ncbi:MAG TPA: molybdate ABC transporter substrate-binding protein [Blastocatellia bacterium]|nr:molybdate ABC transporter substrate-binding protein [Blastocatellia bacterium]
MRLRTLLIIITIACVLFVCGCSRRTSGEHDSKEITVAAAANLTDAFGELGKRFTSQSGIKVVYSFGSTADLTKQIENGAPFDVFAAADIEHIDELNTKGFVISDTRILYARGRLVAWIPASTRATITRIEDIVSPDVKTIAIAKPDLAPYGKASVEALRALNLWSQIEPKVVYGSNVSQTKQYASTGNADVAFIPLSLVKPNEGRYIEVDASLHQPIDQALAIVKASSKQEQARRFTDYIMSADGQAVLKEYGYSKPAGE